METSFWEQINKIAKITPKYTNLSLEEMIAAVLTECGFDTGIMDNVYINRKVNFPGAFYCYKDNDRILAGFLNERTEEIIKEYSDAAEFMLMFVTTAPNCRKYQS